MTTITIPRRFNGPPESANGGWFSGTLAGLVGAPIVRVRLLAPPPLETPLEVERDGDRITLTSPGGPVATGEPADGFEREVGTPVPFADARAAGAAYGGLEEHPFPTCFSCGPARTDGLGLRTAAVGDDTYAAAWVPAEVTPEIVWAALDCPGGWAAGFAGRPMVLGTMTAAVAGLPEPGEECVVMAWPRGGSGRKFLSASALFGADQRLLAHAEAVWIHVDPAAVRPR